MLRMRSLKPFRRPAVWVVLWMLAVAVVVTASLLPGQAMPNLQVSDKVEHGLAYALLAVGAVQLFSSRRALVSAGVALVLLGIVLEILQGAMGLGRAMDPNDALANGVGTLAGLMVAWMPARDWLLRIDLWLFRD